MFIEKTLFSLYYVTSWRHHMHILSLFNTLPLTLFCHCTNIIVFFFCFSLPKIELIPVPVFCRSTQTLWLDRPKMHFRWQNMASAVLFCFRHINANNFYKRLMQRSLIRKIQAIFSVSTVNRISAIVFLLQNVNSLDKKNNERKRMCNGMLK